MPGIQPTYDPNNRDDKELFKRELADRKAFIDMAWRYYAGNHDKNLKSGPNHEDYNVVINVAGQAIDKMVNFFAPDTPVIYSDTDPSINDEIQALLAANDFNILIRDIAQAGFISGHNFVRLIPKENQAVRFSLVDARNVTVFWNNSNHNQLLYYRLTWEVSRGKNLIQDIVPMWLLQNTNLISPNEDYSLGWVVIQYEERNNGKLDELQREEWAHPFPPIIDWKNNPQAHSYYGLSDMRHMSLNDTLNFVAGNLNKVIYHHGGPQTVITGGQLDDADLLKVGHGKILQFPDKDTNVFNLEMRGDLEHSLNFMDVLRASFFAQTKVVDLAMIRDKLARVTNFGVRMIYSDMLDMISSKHRIYGKGLVDLVHYALALMGVDTTNAVINIKFADPLPTDRLTEIEALEIEQRISALSKQTISEQMKRDFQQEVERIGAERTIITNDLSESD